ncbi:USP24 [Bugula neritina]|uniref:USP24 n=1 Tax=Bugula neritina TaxID=10212 RepID=A0A7J7K3F4_BUGNE|nr:USP24 [Bugula neritina]
MEPSDENVQMLLSMGFPSESEVRRALKISKNDMNEAVDMLTNGQSLTYFDDQKSSPDANTLDQGVSSF